jgi:hypothetical protein
MGDSLPGGRIAPLSARIHWFSYRSYIGEDSRVLAMALLSRMIRPVFLSVLYRRPFIDRFHRSCVGDD